MAEIDAVLAAQLGLVVRDQATEAGMSPRTLARRHELARWERVHRNVSRSTAFEVTREQRLLAATLSAGPYSAISHRAAAAMWGVERFDCDLVELTHPFGHHLRLRDVVMHRSSDLVPSDVTTIGGIPVTTRVRTLLDLGAVVRPGLVSRALEQWLREGHTTVRQVRAALDDVSRKGRRGAGVLRQVLDGRALGTQPSDALAELVLAETIRAMGSPQPAYHHLIHVGAEVFEADFAYPELMLAIEVDGYGPHTTPAQFEEDRRRQNLIVEVGYMVQRYTAKRVLSRPRSVAEDVERIRRARAASPWFRGAQGATDGTPRASEPRWAS